MLKKYLLVGTDDVCKQIAYVFNISDYKIINDVNSIKDCSDYNVILCSPSIRFRGSLNVTTFKQLCKKLNSDYRGRFRFTRNEVRNFPRPVFYNKRLIELLPVELLKPSELLIKVLNSKRLDIECTNLEKSCNIDFDGYLYGCCATWVRISFGNISSFNSYDNHIARIIKLSSLNKSFCFCNLKKCRFWQGNKKVVECKPFVTEAYPSELTISIDRSCNLKCGSCRKCYYSAKGLEREKIERLADFIIGTGWLNKSNVFWLGKVRYFIVLFTGSYWCRI